jgi:hypothetical protein
MEDDRIAQIVVRQLLDTIDGLQADLDKEKRARRDAETRLIRATHKRPASPPTSDNGGEGSRRGKRMRNKRGSQEHAPAVPNAPPPSAPSDEPPTTLQGRHLKLPPTDHDGNHDAAKGRHPSQRSTGYQDRYQRPPSLPVTRHQRTRPRYRKTVAMGRKTTAMMRGYGHQ